MEERFNTRKPSFSGPLSLGWRERERERESEGERKKEKDLPVLTYRILYL